ncbi:MAG: hypothetical protein AAGC44_08675 [Planctomycetota bacterium]
MSTQAPTRLALIGMSGIGKSHWSKQLEQRGWVRYDCDAIIADRLGELIQIRQGEDAVTAVGRWMGLPWTEGYEQREAQYLDLERRVTAQALDALAALPADQPAVLDTTGSVIYCGHAVIGRMRERCRVVYLRATPSLRAHMLERYGKEPKPVLWQGAFEPNEYESPDRALLRCYGDLLDARARLYGAMEDVTIPADRLSGGVSLDSFLEMV